MRYLSNALCYSAINEHHARIDTVLTFVISCFRNATEKWKQTQRNTIYL